MGAALQMYRDYQMGSPELPPTVGGREAARQHYPQGALPPVQSGVHCGVSVDGGFRGAPGRHGGDHPQDMPFRRGRGAPGIHLLDCDHLWRGHCYAGGRSQRRPGDDGVSRPFGAAGSTAHHPGDADQRQDVQLGGVGAALPEKVLRQDTGLGVHTALWQRGRRPGRYSDRPGEPPQPKLQRTPLADQDILLRAPSPHHIHHYRQDILPLDT